VLGIERETPEETVRGAIEMLRKLVHARADPQTNLVEVRVEAPYRGLSEQLALRILENVNTFNLERRQLQAAHERAFVDSRVANAESTLTLAEHGLAAFLRRNRSYQNSPELTLEYQRLSWRVTHARDVLTSLVEVADGARLEEVRNTPLILTVDSPHGSAIPAPRNLALHGVLGLSVGALLGLLVSWVRQSARLVRRVLRGFRTDM
jgi:uncharacterized protein involved in exopolysaccharide biosynthesis